MGDLDQAFAFYGLIFELRHIFASPVVIEVSPLIGGKLDAKARFVLSLAGGRTAGPKESIMQARIKNPAPSVPGALEAFHQLGARG